MNDAKSESIVFGAESLSERVIYIIGPQYFYKEVLADVLESKTGAKCLCIKNCEEISEEAINGSKPELFLCDLLGKSFDEFMSEFLSSTKQISNNNLVVLFNVRAGMGIEESCMNNGIRGVLYENDSLSVFLKGITAIYNGELWFSRGAMTKFILEDKDSDFVSIKVRSILTQREIEIISLVAVGCRNEEIAEKLCVSPHTIKTHLYNIYKKINVTNRLQATLWAANNL
jgi:DNA-binding NarL/FixJ family response regulator